jgi:hypothetical protein
MSAVSTQNSTLLDLVVELQSSGISSEDALVTIALSLVNSGQVALTGIFAGTPKLAN